MNHPKRLKILPSFRLISLVIIAVLCAGPLFAQLVKNDSDSNGQLYRIVKTNSKVLIGTLLMDDGREVLIETEELGKIYIPKSQVESMRKIDPAESITAGHFRDAGPFTTRYYFTNNALPIRRGEHYAMVHLYGPEVHFAITDRLSVGLMATWIAAPLGLAVKYSMPTQNEQLNFSVGTIFASSSYLFGAEYYGGLHWASMTVGEAGMNATFSAGFGYSNVPSNSDFSPNFRKAPAISLAGIAPVGKRASFIFDSMVFFGEYSQYQGFDQIPSELLRGARITTIFMPAMRFQKNDRNAFQVALAGVIQYREIPYDGWLRGGNTRSFPVPTCSWLFKF